MTKLIELKEVIEREYIAIHLKKDLYVFKEKDAPDSSANIFKIKDINNLSERKSTWLYLLTKDELKELGKLGVYSDTWDKHVFLDKQLERAIDGLDNHRLVKVDYGNHEIYHETGKKRLPFGFAFDYMQGYINNGRYHLKKAIDIIKEKSITPKSGMWLNEELEIDRVPDYNARRGCSHFLEFVWEPTQKEMDAIAKKCRSYSNKEYCWSDKYRAVFDLDLLGLRAGGAAKYDDFYSSDEYDSGYEDDG